MKDAHFLAYLNLTRLDRESYFQYWKHDGTQTMIHDLQATKPICNQIKSFLKIDGLQNIVSDTIYRPASSLFPVIDGFILHLDGF